MRGKLKNAGIRKKLVCYSYAIITPILMLISTCLFVRNYHRTMAEERELCQKDVENLSGNLDTLLDGMVEFGTYICINNDILAILSSDDAQALNRDSQLWVHEAPMRTLQDMIALKRSDQDPCDLSGEWGKSLSALCGRRRVHQLHRGNPADGVLPECG